MACSAFVGYGGGMTRQPPSPLYVVHIAPDAWEGCALLPPRVARAALSFLRTHMREQPEKHGVRLCGALKGWLLVKRANFKIIYTVDHGAHTVSILRIEPR